MELDERSVLAIALSFIQGIGPANTKKLLAHFGDLETFFLAKRKDLKAISGLPKVAVDSFFDDGVKDRAKAVYERLSKMSAQVHLIGDKSYPYRLSWCNDAPVVLFTKGKAQVNAPRMIAIVGTRQISDEGRLICDEMIAQLAPYGATVVSGLAYGVDIVAHRSCLKRGVPTLACLAHGLDRIYPSAHQVDAKRMLDDGGWVSEYLPGVMPDRNFFPSRNRIIAGLCDATLVVESGIKGGSMITARLANSYQREVFAIPGSLKSKCSEGTNFLIKNLEAALITCGDDIAKHLNWESVQAKAVQLQLDLNDNERNILSCLPSGKSVHIDELSFQAHLSRGELMTVLLNMELKGLISTKPGKHFVRL
ncbi:MAG: DNA-processing protein DprA [Flavobacteriales bacterium]|nr:DNA-processing protein DprA [Flavobacteriales bacterium]